MEEKYWKQFENSGRIEDYLSFVNSTGQHPGDVSSVGDTVSSGDRSAMEGTPSASIGNGYLADGNVFRETKRQPCRNI